MFFTCLLLVSTQSQYSLDARTLEGSWASRSDSSLGSAELSFDDECLPNAEDCSVHALQQRAASSTEVTQFYGYSCTSSSETETWPSKVRLGLPSPEPYKLSVQRPGSSYSQWKQDLILAPILKQIKRGFFVESGARNGEDHSNTLYYESRGWRGLLIEPGHEFHGIAGKHRKSYYFHGALSPSGNSTHLHFHDQDWGLAHVTQDGGFEVQAEPLDKLLAAIDPHRTTVDFWSLDIEGSEAEVLETTNFHKIKVGLLLVEMNKTPENNRRISAVLHKNGFLDIGRTTEPLTSTDEPWNPFVGDDHKYLDHVFVNPAYFQDLGLPVPGKVPGLY